MTGYVCGRGMDEGPHQNLQETRLAGVLSPLSTFVSSCSTGPWHRDPKQPTQQLSSRLWLRLSTRCNKHKGKGADSSSWLQELQAWWRGVDMGVKRRIIIINAWDMIIRVHNRLFVVHDGKYGAGKMTNGGKSIDKELCESLQSWVLSKSCYYEKVNKKVLKL